MNTDINLVKRLMLYIGVAASLVAVWMTFSYGRSMSLAHGVSMGLLTLVAAFIWTAAVHYRKIGMPIAGNMLMVLGVLFTSVEYFSHIGYTVGNRVTVTEETGVQNAAYAGAQDAVTDDKANLGLWRKQLADLTAQNAWAATVKADALRSQVETAERAIALETARGGCKSKCEARMRERDAVMERIGKVEQFEDLTKRIEATQRILDGKRTVAAKTEFKSSPIVNQTKFAAQLATMDIAPSAEAMNWTQIVIGALIAFVTTFLAPTCFFIVFGDSRYEPEDVWARQAQRNSAAPPAQPAAHNHGTQARGTQAQGPTIIRERTLVRDDRSLRKELADSLASHGVFPGRALRTA